MTGFQFSGLWYIQASFAQQMQEVINHRLLQGRDPIPASLKTQAGDAKDRQAVWDQREKNQREVIDDLYDEDGFIDPLRIDLYQYRKAGGGSVAVVPIDGTMARTGYCGRGGNEYTAQILALAEASPKIRAVILKMNTPGGTVDSTRALADAVANFSKPILVWTPACYSAGYYVASQSNEIWMEDQIVSGVGSIGVLRVYEDHSRALEKDGVKVTIYRADGSEQKARVNGVETITPEDEARMKEQLNACRAEFVGYVRRGRAGKIQSDEAFTGAEFNPKKALQLGLADRIGSLQDCINHALKLAA